MTHQPLTKAEREELQNRHRFQSDPDSRDINRLLADLDAAEADVVSMRNEGEEMAGQVMQRFAELEAQRDRAESELDAERRMRVEAEAAAKRAEEERDAQATTLVDERDDAKAKLAALVEVGERWVAANEPIDAGNPFVDHDLKAAIAAARGGAQ